MADTNLMTIAEFSAHLGFGRTYGYQLQKEDRLVLAEDGRRVLVAESIARVRATEDPSKQGVAQRHAAARLQKASPSESGVAAPDMPTDDDPEAGPVGGPVPPGFDFQVAKAKREHFAALEAEASYRARAKELLEASEVRATVSEVMTVLRTAIEGMSHRLAPALTAAVKETEVRAMLDAEIRYALDTASASLAKLGKV
jgi:hypothetical protein